MVRLDVILHKGWEMQQENQCDPSSDMKTLHDDGHHHHSGLGLPFLMMTKYGQTSITEKYPT